MPAYQREYAWRDQEVDDFWTDLRSNLEADYFLGLVILTDNGATEPKDVVDGQQRLLTLTLLVAALHREALRIDRRRLADQIDKNFLHDLDFETETTSPRMVLTDARDDATLNAILKSTEPPETQIEEADSDAALDKERAPDASALMLKAFDSLLERVKADLEQDPFKRLGTWADFLTKRLYFAVFVHPDPASAYRVFEVINTRGKILTPAELLKNYLLSHIQDDERQGYYLRWKSLAEALEFEGDSAFVMFIRHVASLEKGYILPKDLYDYLSGRNTPSPPMTPALLMTRLEGAISRYLQMMDPSAGGPANNDVAQIYGAFNDLGVTAARPLLLAIADKTWELEAATEVLKLVVGRVVAGNLGSGGIERRLSEAAHKVASGSTWADASTELRELRVEEDDFTRALARRAYNKATLTFVRRSIVQGTITPADLGTLHFIRPRGAPATQGWSKEQAAFWETTLGNTFLATVDRRPHGSSTWPAFKEKLLDLGVDGEWRDRLELLTDWTAATVTSIGQDLSQAAAELWL